jgi:hypothetical protein
MPLRRSPTQSSDQNLETLDISPLAPRSMEYDLERLKRTAVVRPAGFTQGQSSFDGIVQDPPTGPLDPGSVPPFPPGHRVRIPIFTDRNALGQSYGITIDADDRGPTGVADSRLLSDLQAAIRELGLLVEISDALRLPGETVGAGSRSRHMRGKALDISKVNGRSASLDHPSRPTNHDAVNLVRWFIRRGYTPGTESGTDRCVLFGNGSYRWNLTSVPHHHHIHISVR